MTKQAALSSMLLLLAALPACTTADASPTSEPEVGVPTAPTAPPAPAPGTGTAKFKTIFTTKGLFQGKALGGLAGADAICNQAAAAAAPKLTGTYKAWLSDVDTSAASRLSHAKVPYRMVNHFGTGIEVAANFDGLISGSLNHEIDRDENGEPIPFTLSDNSAAAWTATLANGGVAPWDNTNTNTTENPRLDCERWSNDQKGVGLLGAVNSLDSAWTQTNTGVGCDETAHLYCVEQ